MKRIDRLLEAMDAATRNGSAPADRALWHLLSQWKDRLPTLDHYFHKAFRQVDVTDDGHTDMAIWCLLHHSTIFWQLVKEVLKKGKR